MQTYKRFILCSLNSYELRLTHEALTLAQKILYKLGLNITEQIRGGGVIYRSGMRRDSYLTHHLCKGAAALNATSEKY